MCTPPNTSYFGRVDDPSGIKTAGVEIARKESAAQKCKGGNCEKQKQWHNVAGGGIVAQASMDSQKNT